MVKQREATLLQYSYVPSFFSERFTAEFKEIRVYVDKDKKHPDPLNKLIWGWDKEGKFVSGDFKERFTRAGKPLKVPYTVGDYLTAAQEQERKTEAIKAFIRGLN